MNQLPLPGVPPVEEQASKEATAETLLIFDSDDAVQARIVATIRDLFTGVNANVNCEAFVGWLLNYDKVRQLIKEKVL
jgi:hypothetical protein